MKIVEKKYFITKITPKLKMSAGFE
jgi:hypothetical protein